VSRSRSPLRFLDRFGSTLLRSTACFAPFEAGFSRRPFTRLQRPPGYPSYRDRVEVPDLSLRFHTERSLNSFGSGLPSSLAISDGAGKILIHNPLNLVRSMFLNRCQTAAPLRAFFAHRIVALDLIPIHVACLSSMPDFRSLPDSVKIFWLIPLPDHRSQAATFCQACRGKRSPLDFPWR
jgi:hypothetical protein